jgi:hypothetical protein
VAKASGIGAAHWILSRFGLYIGDLYRSPVEGSTSGDNLTR